jgi:hypothetical protein
MAGGIAPRVLNPGSMSTPRPFYPPAKEHQGEAEKQLLPLRETLGGREHDCSALCRVCLSLGPLSRMAVPSSVVILSFVRLEVLAAVTTKDAGIFCDVGVHRRFVGQYWPHLQDRGVSRVSNIASGSSKICRNVTLLPNCTVLPLRRCSSLFSALSSVSGLETGKVAAPTNMV